MEIYRPDGPPPEGVVRAVLAGESYGEPATFHAYEQHTPFDSIREASEMFDVPREQYDRWRAAQAAFDAMQNEIEALIEARYAATKKVRSNHQVAP